MKFAVLIPVVAAPILLAWALSAYMFQSGPLMEANWEGYGEVFRSYAVMFCIATYVPVFLMWLISRSGGWRHDE